MTWVAKSGTPAYANMAQAFIATITGDANWGWLADFGWLMGDVQIDVPAFCAAGPPPEIDPLAVLSSFGPTSRPSILTIAARTADQAATIGTIARSRLFSAWCEQSAPVATCTTLASQTLIADGGGGVVPVGGYLTPLAIPPGTTSLRITWTYGSRFDDYGIALVMRRGDGNFIADTNAGANARPLHPGVAASFPWVQSTNPTVYFGYVYVAYNSTNTFLIEACNAGTDFVSLVPTEPAGFAPPTGKTYTNIPDLGAELDNLEHKLDAVLPLLLRPQAPIASTTTVIDSTPLGPADDSGVTDVPLGTVGLVVHVTGIPGYEGFRSGDPLTYSDLGLVTIGTSSAWYEPIRLRHPDTIIAPLPPLVARVGLTVRSPMQATVSPIRQT